jgi:autotransporter adhesin
VTLKGASFDGIPAILTVISDAIWRGGWVNNLYSDTVSLEIANGTVEWIEGEGKLATGEGVYY